MGQDSLGGPREALMILTAIPIIQSTLLRRYIQDAPYLFPIILSRLDHHSSCLARLFPTQQPRGILQTHKSDQVIPIPWKHQRPDNGP